MIGSVSPHAVLAAAAEGRLPGWAAVGAARRDHLTRVAGLMKGWAGELELPPEETERWLAAAYLHDAMKGVAPSELRVQVAPKFREWPAPLLHGPGVAARLRREGVEDSGLLLALQYHTVGHPNFDRVGQALYMADFLEPGRPPLSGRWVWARADAPRDLRAHLRSRMPGEWEAVLLEVARARIVAVVQATRSLHAETAAFWTKLARGAMTSRGDDRAE